VKILGLLIFLFALTACGTDSGNPGLSDTVSAPALVTNFVDTAVCATLSRCYNVSANNCLTGMQTAAYFTAAMGLDQNLYPTLNQVDAALTNGELTIRNVDLSICQQAIQNLTCASSEVGAAYDPANAADFSSTFHLLSASVSCQTMVH
jgi:hypothetical protein